MPPSPISVYGAYLHYGRGGLSDSPLNLTLTVGARDRVFCVQPEATGPVPTSIEWYNPQGLLVSKDGGDEVNQVAGVGGGRITYLNFQSYQQSQGGKYECRVAGPGNNTESLLVCIGECNLLCTLQFIDKSPPTQQIYMATSWEAFSFTFKYLNIKLKETPVEPFTLVWVVVCH